MNSCRRWAISVSITSATAFAGSYLLPAQVTAHQVKMRQSRIAFSHALPQLAGSHLKVTVVEVTYGPGEFSVSHSHPCPVIGYVVQGAIRTQVKGEPEAVLKTGDSFYEAPNGIHLVSANASQKEPAKLLAYFVCDHDTPLSVTAPQMQAPEGK